MKKTLAFLLMSLVAPTMSLASPVYVFDQAGNCLERNTTTPSPPLAAFQRNHGLGVILHAPEVDPIHPAAPVDKIKATLQAGQVMQIALDPAWTPPAQATDPLDELRSLVRGNILASDHDKRWLAQKEAAKLIAIPWIKAHPACTQAEFQAAVFSALASELPAGEPIVVNPDGIIASYALAAQARGLIQEASFTALRDLVADTPEKHLNKLLAEL